MSEDRYADIMIGLDLFAGFTEHGAKALIDLGEVKEHEAGELLIREKGESKFVMLVLTGKMCVFVEREGKELVLTEVGPGVTVGEIGVLCGIPRAASVRTMEPSAVLHWSDSAFRSLLVRDLFLSQRIFARLLRNLIANEQTLIESVVKSRGA